MKKLLTKLCAFALCFVSLATLACCGEDSKKKPTNDDNKAESSETVDTDKVKGYIVRNGAPNYTVIIPDGASECIRYAADELHDIVAECTGAYLPIREEGQYLYSSASQVISLGQTSILDSYDHGFDYDVLNGDGFYLQTFDKSLFVAGETDRSVLYGVYEFVERFLGVKFLYYDFTVYPKTETLPLYEMEIKSIPDFRYRGALIRAGNRGDADRTFYARTRQSHEFIDVDEKYGGSISWYDGVNVAHNTLSYVPKAEYFSTAEQQKDNAEMYYLKNGEPYDLCWTNGITEDGKIDESKKTSTLKAAIESLKRFIQDEPETEFYPMGQEDNRDGFCTCQSCVTSAAKYTAAGTIIRFVNCMIEEVQKWVDSVDAYRGKTVKMVIFAYMYSLYAPVEYDEKAEVYRPIDESVVPNENVWIRIAPLDQNMYYALSDEGQSKKMNSIVRQWGDITDNLMTWIYGSNFHNYWSYHPTIQKIRRELTDMRKAGFDYVFIQLDHSEFNDVQQIMNAYVYMKMLWDCDRDPYALRAEFIHYYFGPAEQIVRGVYEFMDEYYLEMEKSSGGAFSLDTMNSLYHPIEYLEYLSDECDRAIETVWASDLTVEEKETYQIHIERVKLTPLFMRVTHGAKYYAGNEQANNAVRKEFQLLCDKLNVIYMAEVVGYSEWKKSFPYVD